MTTEKRSIRSIALDIRKEWAKVNYAASFRGERAKALKAELKSLGA